MSGSRDGTALFFGGIQFAMDIVYLLLGFVVLFVGGELTLRGAVGMANSLGVSPALIGLTVVAFGTSAPELFVTIQAALDDKVGLAIGNVVGSNISNLLLILGAGAIIFPLACSKSSALRDGALMVGATVILVILGMMGIIVLWQGVAMLVILVAAMIYAYRQDKASGGGDEDELEELESAPTKPLFIYGYVLIGIVGLVAGSHFLVEGAVGIARALEVPESIIGLTMVALGTSLPELTATTIAAARKQTEMAIANVMGSNAFNILLILGVTSLIKPLPVDPVIQGIDMWVMLGVTLGVMALLFVRNFTIGRGAGLLLVGGYIAYIASIAHRIV